MQTAGVHGGSLLCRYLATDSGRSGGGQRHQQVVNPKFQLAADLCFVVFAVVRPPMLPPLISAAHPSFSFCCFALSSPPLNCTPLLLSPSLLPARLSIITMHPSTVSIGSSKACSIRPHESPPSHGRRVAVGLHGDSNDDVPLRSLELNRRGSAARGAGAKLRLLCLLRVVIGAARAAVLLVQAAVQGHMGCVDKRRGRRQSLGQRQRWRRGAPPPLAAPRLPEESARSQLFERRLAQPTLARPVVVS